MRIHSHSYDNRLAHECQPVDIQIFWRDLPVYEMDGEEERGTKENKGTRKSALARPSGRFRLPDAPAFVRQDEDGGQREER